MDLGQMMELIKGRRSIRRFSKEKIDKKQLETLVEAAIWAPSGSNAQAWQFIVVDDEIMLQRLTAFLPGVLQAPPALICLCVDYRRELDRAGKLGCDVLGIMDVSMAAQNIMLAAKAMGLGSCVIRGFNEEVMRMALSLPEDVKPELLVILGYPEKPDKAPVRRPLDEVLHWQKYRQEDEVQNG
ncbi:MAG TPA: nitroreductase family protein [Bacillota bacterium]|jgi:nitroreductase|nr:nitroreductase family protein [Bacillota bacterium]